MVSFTPGERAPGAHLIDWVGPKASVDVTAKINSLWS